MGAFLCNEWMGIISIVAIIVCFAIATISKTTSNTPVICIITIILGGIMLLVHTAAVILNKQGEIQDTYKESAVIVDTYETSHLVRIGRICHYRHSYHIVIKGEETEHKEKFQVKSETYSQLKEGDKVTLTTNTIKTRFIDEITKTYDWEKTEIK